MTSTAGPSDNGRSSGGGGSDPTFQKSRRRRRRRRCDMPLDGTVGDEDDDSKKNEQKDLQTWTEHLERSDDAFLSAGKMRRQDQESTALARPAMEETRGSDGSLPSSSSSKDQSPQICETPPTPQTPFSPETPPTPPSEDEGTRANAKDNHKRQRPNEGESGALAKKKKNRQQQLYLDFGQANFGRREVCAICGMMTVHGLAEDSRQHERICKDYRDGVSVSASWLSSSRTVATFGNAESSATLGRVVEIRPSDSLAQGKKLLQVQQIVDQELGFARSSRRSDPDKTIYLYLAGKTIVGFCAVQLIERAYPLLVKEEGCTYVRSTTPQRAVLGVHQLWCHGRHRRVGIATRLVDAARDSLVFGMRVATQDVALSSPSASGIAFALRYLHTATPLVYDCR